VKDYTASLLFAASTGILNFAGYFSRKHPLDRAVTKIQNGSWVIGPEKGSSVLEREIEASRRNVRFFAPKKSRGRLSRELRRIYGSYSETLIKEKTNATIHRLSDVHR